jgi:hypothetical protein
MSIQNFSKSPDPEVLDRNRNGRGTRLGKLHKNDRNYILLLAFAIFRTGSL